MLAFRRAKLLLYASTAPFATTPRSQLDASRVSTNANPSLWGIRFGRLRKQPYTNKKAVKKFSTAFKM